MRISSDRVAALGNARLAVSGRGHSARRVDPYKTAGRFRPKSFNFGRNLCRDPVRAGNSAGCESNRYKTGSPTCLEVFPEVKFAAKIKAQRGKIPCLPGEANLRTFWRQSWRCDR